MILIINNKEEMIVMTLIIFGKDGVDLRQEYVEEVYVKFTDGTSKRFVSEGIDDAVIINHSEIKYIVINGY